jgi:predicted homoserine dehydrogenase-like protein
MPEESRRTDLEQIIFQGGTLAASLETKLATARAIDANDRIRVGIIGAGSRGQHDLKTAIAVPNVECVAMADV